MPKKIGGIIMLSKIRALKEKKGFTLVELIVVLVILAILAALLIPALTGYIDRANKEKIIAETRQCVMAAQTIAAEKYATTTKDLEFGTDKELTAAAVQDLAEVKGTVSAITFAKAGDSKYAGQIKTLTYTDGKKTCTYTAGATEPYSVS